MRLAEALIKRKELFNTLSSLIERIGEEAVIPEDETPSETAAELLEEYDGLVSQLDDLIGRINKTNNKTKLTETKTLSDAIIKRDMLKLKHNAYESILNNIAYSSRKRVKKDEVKYLSTLSVPGIRKALDNIAKEIRELNVSLQATNWAVELE